MEKELAIKSKQTKIKSELSKNQFRSLDLASEKGNIKLVKTLCH